MKPTYYLLYLDKENRSVPVLQNLDRITAIRFVIMGDTNTSIYINLNNKEIRITRYPITTPPDLIRAALISIRIHPSTDMDSVMVTRQHALTVMSVYFYQRDMTIIRDDR